MDYQKMYYDLADAIARESGSHDELCEIARETRNERNRLREQVAVVPDLLDALVAASHMIYGELYYDHPTAIQVRAAIAKATAMEGK